MTRHAGISLLVAAALACSSLSCSTVQEIGKAMANLRRLQFKLDGVSNFTLAGVPLSNKASISMEDGLKLLPAFENRKFPATFTLNVAAMNPNNGTGGTPQSTATMTSFAWTLLIDSNQTVSGNIANPVTIPGTGQQTVIPLQVSLDLYQFFQQQGYQDLLNLALALGGANRTPTRLALRARPTIQTDLGPITYPGEITIVDKEFRGQ